MFIATEGGDLRVVSPPDSDGQFSAPWLLYGVNSAGYGWGLLQGFLAGRDFFMEPAGNTTATFEGLEFVKVFGVNDRGQAFLRRIDYNDVENPRFLILNTSAIPEPSTWILAAAGLSILLSFKSKLQ